MAFGQDEDYSDKPVEEGKTYEVEIDDVGSKGDGIARVEGFVVFVPETDIGDRVEVEINSVGRKFAFGEVQEHLGTVEDGADDLEEADDEGAFGDEDASTLEEEEDDEWDMDADEDEAEEDEAVEEVAEAADEADDEEEAEEVVEEEAVEDALEDEADLDEDEAEDAAEEAVESLEDEEEEAAL